MQRKTHVRFGPKADSAPAGCAEPLEVTHDQWIFIFEALGIDAKRYEKLLQKIGRVRPFFRQRGKLGLGF